MVKLGTLIKEVTIKTTINNQYEVLTSSQNGIVSQEEYFNKQVASQNNVGYKIIKKGQFTYRSMSDTGKFYINRLTNKDIGIVSPAYPVFEIVSNKIIPEYMELFFKTNLFQNQISNKSAGSTRLALRFSKLESVMIPVPDVSFQRNIVNNIKTIHSGLTCEQKHYSYYDELIKSRFNEMFSKCKADTKLGDVSNICRGASPRPISSFITKDINGINWIKIGDVENDAIYITKTEERITRAGANKSKEVHIGDFILSNSMSFGRPYILGINGCVHDGWLIISNYQHIFEPLFLYYSLRSDDVQNQFIHEASGTTVKNLNSDIVKNIFVIKPPLKEQKEFSSFVNQIDKLKFNVQKRIEYYQELLNKKMDEYFN